MTAQTLLKQSTTLIEDTILEKKSSTFNFKNFYLSQPDDFSPYLKKEKKVQHNSFTKLSHLLKEKLNIFFHPDKFSQEKKELNLVFKNLIEHKNFKEMNEFLEHGFIPEVENYKILLTKIDKDTGENSLFPMQKKESLHGILAQFLFVNAHFQIYCHSIFEKLQKQFPNEYLSSELFSELYDNDKKYNNYSIKQLSYDKENLLAAVNMHNLCLEPTFSFPLFCHALKRIFNHNQYNYTSLEWSVGAVLTISYSYISSYLSLDDKQFLADLIKNQKDKIFKEGRSTDECKVLDKIHEVVSADFQLLDKSSYKEQLLQQVKKIYSNDTIKIASQHFIPLKIEQQQLLPQHNYLINQIKQIHGQLSNFEQFIDNDTIENINKLVSETLMLTIEKYNNIKPEFRENIKNIEGKNSHELLEESLSNILLIMKDTELKLEQEKVNDLSLINRKNRIK